MLGHSTAPGPEPKDTVVAEVRDNIQASWESDRDNRRDAASDLQFLAGDQWPDWIRRQRQDDNRPMLTINRLPQFLRQVTNDIRQADLGIKTTPVDDHSDPDLAELYNDLLRQIQYMSSAKHVFSDAAEHQAACGIGWFRIVTQYADDMAFDQEIRLKRIPHPLSVYCDPAAVEADRSDAMWLSIVEMLPRDTFKAMYPEAEVSSMDVPSNNESENIFWSTSDTVRRAEYWRKVPHEIELALMDDGTTLPLEEIPSEMRSFLPIVNTRKATTYRVEQHIVSGNEVLEEKVDWIGKHIPIVPVIGSEIPLEGKRYRHGVIRFARDPQQLYNFYRTAVAENIALAPKAPYLLTPKMIKGFKAVWDRANFLNRPYLPYNPDEKAPGARPIREAPPEIPASLMQEAAIAADDMKSTTGIHDASLGAQGNETSGIAIAKRQLEGDVANYHYADNLQRSLEHAGRIMIDLIPKVYDNERIVRLRGENGDERTIGINQVMYAEDGVPVMLNDLSAGRFDVRVTIGPSYSTKRVEAANSLIEFSKALPQAAEVSADLIAKNLDFPGAEELAERLKKLMPPHITADPNDPEAPQEPQGPPEPHPLEVAKAEADIAKTQADTANKNADAMKKLAEIDEMDAVLGNLGQGQPLPGLPGGQPL